MRGYASRNRGSAGGQPAETEDDLSTEQLGVLQDSVDSIVARTREFLPDVYTVGGEVGRDATGVRATIAVRPPVGSPVSAGFVPEFEDDPTPVPEDERDEVARGLAASAAHQVKQALEEKELTAAAR